MKIGSNYVMGDVFTIVSTQGGTEIFVCVGTVKTGKGNELNIYLQAGGNITSGIRWREKWERDL